uniref:Cysteinyl-tRNA synthetase n=2 Tax=Aegilops tauschii TaxID=37682 RepID=M8BZR5_AEGTA
MYPHHICLRSIAPIAEARSTKDGTQALTLDACHAGKVADTAIAIYRVMVRYSGWPSSWSLQGVQVHGIGPLRYRLAKQDLLPPIHYSWLTERGAAKQDYMCRYLNFLGYEVNYVRNFTDVDDKIIERAKQNGEDISSLCTRFINEFHTHMSELQCLPPTVEPRVTKHIKDIVDLINEIIKNDKGYAVDRDVYFSIDRFPEYLSLSGRKQDDNLAGSRVDVDPKKLNDADFALWKASLMHRHEQFTLVHRHFILILITVSRLLRRIMTQYHPMALRFFLVRAHYKSDMNNSDEALEIASDRVYYIYKTLHDCDETVSLYREENISVPVPAEEQKLVDGKLILFLIVVKKLQQKLEQQKKKQQQKKQQQQQIPQNKPEDHIQALAALSAEIKSKLSILGLMPPSPLAEELEHLKEKALTRAGLTEESLREQIEQRVAARNSKQFDVSDHIRKDLASKGIALMDEPTGTVWRPCERE